MAAFTALFILAACTTRVPGATPATEPPTTNPLPSEPAISLAPTNPPPSSNDPEIPTAFSELSWTATDPETDELIVGRGTTVLTRLVLDVGRARADWDAVAWVDEQDGRAVVGVIAGDRQLGPWPVDLDAGTAMARISPDGRTVYVHGMLNGSDGGVLAIGLEDGAVGVAVPADDTAKGRERGVLSWSSTGQTLFSTLCNDEDCLVDLIPPSGDPVRLSRPFPAIALTDKRIIGRTGPGYAVELWDIDRDQPIKTNLDELNPTAMLPLGADRFVINDIGETGDSLYLVESDGTVTEAGGPGGLAGLRLMRMPILEDRLVPVGSSSTFSDMLADSGTIQLQWLNLDTGTLSREVSIDITR